MKRFLAATDLSSRSERALRRAAALCAQLQAGLLILHVVDDDQPAELVEQEARQAAILIQRQAEKLAAGRPAPAAGLRPRILVRTGDAFQKIVETAGDEDAALIVMGAHRKRILRDVFVGTTIERVMRTGRHPVLMVNDDADAPYRDVMAAVDLSDASGRALLAAKALGLLDRAEVSVVHAFQPFAKGMMLRAGVEPERMEEYVAQEALEAARQVASFLAGLSLGELSHRALLEEGTPFPAIRKAVEEHHPQLLVIGTRGLTGLKRVLLGSVADAVLREIECDVLAVPSGAG